MRAVGGVVATLAEAHYSLVLTTWPGGAGDTDCPGTSTTGYYVHSMRCTPAVVTAAAF